MAATLAFDKYEPFSPEAAKAMEIAFDSAWDVLVTSGSELAATSFSQQTRDDLAMRIIDAAKAGEHNADVLREIALRSVLKTNLKRA